MDDTPTRFGPDAAARLRAQRILNQIARVLAGENAIAVGLSAITDSRQEARVEATPRGLTELTRPAGRVA